MKMVLQPGREHLEKRRDEIEKLLKENGPFYELRRPGRKTITIDLKKQLKEVKVMIKAQKKFDKRTDPSAERTKALRAELMTLTKSKVVDLYLNLLFSEARIQTFHIPTYKRGLYYKNAMTEYQKGSRIALKKNTTQRIIDLCTFLKVEITAGITPSQLHTRLKGAIKTIEERRGTIPEDLPKIPDKNTIKDHLPQIKNNKIG